MKTQCYYSPKARIFSASLPVLFAILVVPVLISPVFGQDFFSDPIPASEKFGIDINLAEGEFVTATLGDLDGDGDLDLFYSINMFTTDPCAVPVDLYYYENTGSNECPHFESPVSFPFGIPDEIAQPTFVDIDGDGDLDMFANTWCFSGVILFVENTGSPTTPEFGESEVMTNPFNIHPLGIASPALVFGDIDNDGDYDVFITGRTLGYFQFQENITESPSEPQFGHRQQDPYGLHLPYEPDGTSRAALLDWDCDGDLDILNALAGPDFYYYENISQNPDEPLFDTALQLPNDPIAIQTYGDLDGDGDEDAMSYTFYGENIAQHPGCVTPPEASFEYSVDGLTLAFINGSTAKSTECNPVQWLWDFGDGTTSEEENPLHAYAEAGDYEVCLTVVDVAGSHTYCNTVSKTHPEPFRGTFSLYANPASDFLYLELTEGEALRNIAIEIFDAQGRMVKRTNLAFFGPEARERIEVGGLPAGVYTVKMTARERFYVQQFVKMERKN